MKKWMFLAGFLFLCRYAHADGNYYPALVVSSVTQQGFLYQVPTSTNTGGVLTQAGGAFNWSNSVIGATTTATPNQFPAMPAMTLVAIQALTPASAGQLVFCYNCASTPLLISTGTTNNAWVAVSVSSGATTGLGAPK